MFPGVSGMRPGIGALSGPERFMRSEYQVINAVVRAYIGGCERYRAAHSATGHEPGTSWYSCRAGRERSASVRDRDSVWTGEPGPPAPFRHRPIIQPVGPVAPEGSEVHNNDSLANVLDIRQETCGMPGPDVG